MVLVATVRALKYHGGVAVPDLGKENLAALEKGMVNLQKHLHNIRHHYGLPCVVAINHRTEDTAAEVAMLEKACAAYDAKVVVAKHWAQGGAGALDLAKAVVDLCEQTSEFKFVYEEQDTLWQKAEKVAQRIYGAQGVSADPKAKTFLDKLQEQGFGHYPICIAKTQYSFSTNPKALGAPSGHTLHIREVRLAAGAEFVVMVCGDVMTMPGLPKIPSAHAIDVDAAGNITGLF